MASPFRIFRRNQKIMLAVLGIAVMIAFVLADFLTNLAPSRDENNAAAVDVLGKTLDETQLKRLVNDRRAVQDFVGELVAMYLQSLLGDNFRNPQISQEIDREIRREQQALLLRLNPQPEAAAVETLIYARQAEAAGMVVSDEAVNDYIDQTTKNRVESPDIKRIIDHLKKEGHILGESQLFASLRRELLASQYLRTFRRGALSGLTPAERWEAFKRVNRSAIVEVAAVNVVDFIDKIPEPTEQQLAEFYAKYSDRIAQPGSPEPGFKRPKRAMFQWFKAEVNHVAAQMDVKDEEISEHYERFKDLRYLKPELPALPDEKKPAADETKQDPPADSDEKKEPGAADKPTDEKNEKAPAPDGDEKKATEPAAESKESESKPDAKDPPKLLSGAVGASRPRFTLVKAQVADDKKSDTDKAAADPKPDTPAAAADDKKPAAEEDKAADAPATTDEKPTVDDEKPAADDKEPKTEEKPAAKEYLPLSSVRLEIQQELRKRKADEAIRTMFEDLQLKMTNYRNARSNYLAHRPAGDRSPYEPFALEDLAKEKGVGAHETPRLISQQELSETDLGKSFILLFGGQRQEPFHRYAYSNQMVPFVSLRSFDTNGDWYLSWKIEDAAEQVMPLAQIRRRVVDAWKLEQARPLARKMAEEYAAAAKKSSADSLADVLSKSGGPSVVEPAKFTWFTRGPVPSDTQAQLRLSQVEGLDGAGQDFMKVVFSLAPTEAGVAMNEAQNKVYLVRLKRYDPLDADLREDFAAAEPDQYLGAAFDRLQIAQDWYAGLAQEAGVHWHRETKVSASQ